MRYVRICGFSDTPWRDLASSVRLRRLETNKGFGLERARSGVSIIDQLAAAGDDDFLVIGYQPAVLAIASALSRGNDPYECLTIWKQERDCLVEALGNRAERTVAVSINSAAADPLGFAQRLGVRTGLEFSSSKSLRLPELSLLDRYIAQQVVSESDAQAGHLELDYSSLLPALPVELVRQEEFIHAILSAREAQAQLGADIRAFTATLIAATDASSEYTSLTRSLRRSRLSGREDEHAVFAEAVIDILRARHKKIRALEKSVNALGEKLVIAQVDHGGRTTLEMPLSTDAKGGGVAKVREPGSGNGSTVSLHPMDCNVMAEIFEISNDELSRRDDEIELLRELLVEGLDVSTASAFLEPKNQSGISSTDAQEHAADISPMTQVRKELPRVPDHVVISKKSRRDPVFWFQTARDYWLLKGSRLFDADWYLRRYPELARKKWDPVLHYLLHGGREGRPASRYFCSAKYLHCNPEVIEQGINPLVHYLRIGRSEMRQTYRPSV